MSARLTWDGGHGAAELASVRDLAVVLLSEKAFPPGARPTGVLHVAEDHGFQVKVHGSRKVGERFEVRATLINATVAVRTAFQAAVAPPAAPC